MIPFLHRAVPSGVDFTESWSEWETWFKEAVLEAVLHQQWRLYPQQQPVIAQQQLGEHLAIDPDRIEFTRGADAAVDEVVRSAATRGHVLFTPSPAYPGYERAAQRHRAVQQQYSALMNAIELASISAEQPSTVIVTWPGNPIGLHAFDATAVPSTFQRWVVDATSAPIFSEAFRQLVSRGGNGDAAWDVIFSASKTYGLAGIRLGGIIHSAASKAQPVQRAFNLDYLQLAAANALTSPEVRDRLRSRERIARTLQSEILQALHTLGYQAIYTAAAAFSSVTDETSTLPDSLHAKRFPAARLTRVTTCPHNLRELLAH